MSHESDITVHPEIDGLTLFMAPPGPHRHAVHAHDAYSVIVLTSGAKAYQHGSTSVVVQAEQIAIANPAEPHGCGPIDDGAWSHMTWYLSVDLVREILGLRSGSEAPKLRAPVIADDALARQLNRAHERARQGSLLQRQTEAIDVLTTLFDQYSVSLSARSQTAERPGATGERMIAYEHLLQQSYEGPLDLSTLASAAGVHRNQVIRDFRQVHGVTPAVYWRHVQLSEAKGLIRAGASLAEAASSAGYADQSHFTRSFRAAFGITPSRFKALAEVEQSGATI